MGRARGSLSSRALSFCPLISAFILVCVVVSTWKRRHHGVSAQSLPEKVGVPAMVHTLPLENSSKSANSNNQSPILAGTYFLLEDRYEFVYQLPPPSTSNEPIRGVVFLAHGCSHRATDWWPASETCPTCLGLPVERGIVTEALRRGYAAIALSSSNKINKCWSNRDLGPAYIVLKHFYSTILHKAANSGVNTLNKSPPLHLLGASSGGSFVGLLGMHASSQGLPIASICIQISALHHEWKSGSIPPSIFVHMNIDEMNKGAIKNNLARLQREKIPAQELGCNPKPITPHFFSSEHSYALSDADSATLQSALRVAGYLTDEGFLKEDPRSSHWRDVVTKALPHIVPSKDTLEADKSPISELLNLAWALHEITGSFLLRNVHITYNVWFILHMVYGIWFILHIYLLSLFLHTNIYIYIYIQYNNTNISHTHKYTQTLLLSHVSCFTLNLLDEHLNETFAFFETHRQPLNHSHEV